ncbi:hypothetical protein [Amycolatopsis sp. NPDC054798]
MHTEWVSWASVAIALVSVLYARRSARTGIRSLDVASTIGQVNYEDARANHTPIATLTLTEVEHRTATAQYHDGLLGAEAHSWAERHESDNLEVVARGKLVNNTDHELLLTLHDHPQARRRSWAFHRNQSIMVLDGAPADLNRAVLPAGATTSFDWIDRRTQQEWISIQELDGAHDGTSSPFQRPLSWRDYIKAPFDLHSTRRIKERKISRSGFYLVCESRANERVATIWYAEVVEAPVAVDEYLDVDRTSYKPMLRTIPGPIDDDIIRYRVTFDPVLALLRPPKLRRLRGRN